MYTQEYIDNLPHYGVKEVQLMGKKGRAKIGLKHFHSTNACGKCSCYIKVCSDQLNRIFCASCTGCFKDLGLTLPMKERKVRSTRNTEPDPDKPFSVATIKYGLSLHNQKSVKAAKDGWKLPTVFYSNIK